MVAALTSGCWLEDGARDFGGDLATPKGWSLDAPGMKLSGEITAGELKVSPSGQWLTVTLPSGEVKVVVPGTGTVCSVGVAAQHAFFWAGLSEILVVQDRVTAAGTGRLRVFDGHCKELGPAIQHATFPVPYYKASQYDSRWVSTVAGELTVYDARTQSAVSFGSGILEWIALSWTNADLMILRYPGELRVVEPTGRVRQRLTGISSVMEDPEWGITAYFPEEHLLYDWDYVNEQFHQLMQDVCYVSPLQPQCILRQCGGKTYFADWSSLTEPLVEVPEQTVRYLRVGEWTGLLRSSEPTATTCSFWRVEPTKDAAPSLSDVRCSSVTLMATPEGWGLQALRDGPEGPELVRRSFGSPDIHELTHGVYEWPLQSSNLPFIDHWNGKTGRWVRLRGYWTPQLDVIAEGVAPPSGFAPMDNPFFFSTAFGRLAYLQHVEGGVGELVVARTEVVGENAPLPEEHLFTVPDVALGDFSFIAQRRMLVYLTGASSGKGELHSYLSELELRQLVASGVSAMVPTVSPDGVAYLVPEGERRGLWHVRLR